MSAHKYLLIALGGGLGSMARFWVASAVAQRFGARFHYGTLAVNLSACAIMGFSLALLSRREADWGLAWSFLIPIGFVGAYSTFSTFEWVSRVCGGVAWRFRGEANPVTSRRALP